MIGFITVQLLTIILVNIYGTIDSYCSYYYGASHPKSLVHRITEKITFFKPVWTYATYAGTNASYGFYAPNVASQFGLVFSVYDSSGTLLGTDLHPHLANRESQHRFDLCVSMMQDKLANDGKNLALNDYLKVMIHEVAMNIKGNYVGATNVDAMVYLYEFPTIAEFRSGKTDSRVDLVDEFKF